MIAAVLIALWTILAVSLAVYGARSGRRRPKPAAPRPTGHVRIVGDQRVFDWERDG